ncbi:hypothetical protein RJ639_021021 [Escallonia herrerae]|uniref:Uncharacterized protein n=1 Tax=Escallonia herrerae TaxID=1293975 RepID=A0AA88V5C2_9ASTE|nr:hypothetical protein RJ639_021021 [Escallonia herrerae]
MSGPSASISSIKLLNEIGASHALQSKDKENYQKQGVVFDENEIVTDSKFVNSKVMAEGVTRRLAKSSSDSESVDIEPDSKEDAEISLRCNGFVLSPEMKSQSLRPFRKLRMA